MTEITGRLRDVSVEFGSVSSKPPNQAMQSTTLRVAADRQTRWADQRLT